MTRDSSRDAATTAYLFPEPAAVRLVKDRHQGAWKDINGQSWAGAAGDIHKDVLTLWIDHGIAPQNAEYVYIVVPELKSSEVNRYQDRSPEGRREHNRKLQHVIANRVA